MIILKLKKCKPNEKENKQMNLLEKYKRKEDFYFLECPHCKSDNLIKWGSYKRTIYFIDENNQLRTELIEIKRKKCKTCKRTHALLPECIVPYKQPILDVILLSISDDPISYEFPFSYETIENWKRSYRKRFLVYLKTMFKNKEEIIPQILKDTIEVYNKFYEKNKMILMMTHQGIKNMACF